MNITSICKKHIIMNTSASNYSIPRKESLNVARKRIWEKNRSKIYNLQIRNRERCDEEESKHDTCDYDNKIITISDKCEIIFLLKNIIDISLDAMNNLLEALCILIRLSKTPITNTIRESENLKFKSIYEHVFSLLTFTYEDKQIFKQDINIVFNQFNRFNQWYYNRIIIEIPKISITNAYNYDFNYMIAPEKILSAQKFIDTIIHKINVLIEYLQSKLKIICNTQLNNNKSENNCNKNNCK